jgi:hypothetical protein
MASSGIQLQNTTVATGLTALAGGGATGATLLTGNINVVATCATSADSAILPASQPQGTELVVRNSGAAACAVFPNTGATINGGTVTSGSVSVTNAKGAIFYQVGTDGLTWVTGALAA